MSTKNDTTTIRVTSETRRQIKMLAAQHDVTMQAMIEKILSLYRSKTCKPEKS